MFSFMLVLVADKSFINGLVHFFKLFWAAGSTVPPHKRVAYYSWVMGPTSRYRFARSRATKFGTQFEI